MNFADPIKLYHNEVRQAQKYLLKYLESLKDNDKVLFGKIEYIYEVHYNGIKVINNTITVEKTLDTLMKSTLSSKIYSTIYGKISCIENIERYLLSFSGIPQGFMLDEYFSIVNNKKLEIKIHYPREVNFIDMKDTINNKNIRYIKFFHNEHIWEMNLKDGKIIDFSLVKVIDINKEIDNYFSVSGYYKENNLKVTYLITKTERDRFLEIINDYDYDIIMAYHNITKEEQPEILRLIKKGDNVESAVNLRDEGEMIRIFDDNFNYAYYVCQENFDESDYDCIDEYE